VVESTNMRMSQKGNLGLDVYYWKNATER